MGATAEPGADEGLPNPPKLWTPEAASARIAELSGALTELRGGAVRLRQVHAELERLATFWGPELHAADNPDRALHERLAEEGKALNARLEAEVARLSEEGIEVKDLDAGLLDFYGLVLGEIVFLCWRAGEEEVGHYHPLDGGFRSRRPLPHPPARATPRSGRAP